MTAVAHKPLPPDFYAGDAPPPTDDGGAAARVLGTIRDLNLEKNAWELDTLGYTVLSPAQVGAPALVARMREVILERSAASRGVVPDVVTGNSHRDLKSFLGSAEYNTEILYEDPAFEKAILTPSVLALVTYLVGESCALTAMNGVIKGPGEAALRLHSDTPQPNPLPAYAQICNATWLLSDTSAENGSTIFVPGSHLWCRSPLGDETLRYDLAKPLETPAGSVVIWHGNTWHGALARSAPGLRITLITYFSRYYMKGPQRDTVEDRVTQAMLDRNPERFTLLMGKKRIGAVGEIRCRHSRFA
jgi:ectoine hydroxylase-related dioxygenase (phytanoyl-CoA dioxygenase family)